MRAMCLALLLPACLAAAACKPKEFTCSRNEECTTSSGSATGLCVESHCAYVDPTCLSGWRFDDTAGSTAEECVDPALLMTPDGGTATPDAAPGGPDAAPGGPDASAPDAAAPDAAAVDASAPDA